MTRFTYKPDGESTLFLKFRCVCGKEHLVNEHYGEWSDPGDGDSLDFRCECGAYYKKIHRIPDEAVLERWYEKGFRHHA